MGFGLRFREKVKQTGKKGAAQPDKNGFVPTSYERVHLTYEEAVKFADSLKTIRKRISEANHARTKMLRDVETTLTGSLPCIHEIDPVTGEHNTSEAAPEGSATYVHTGTLTRLSEEQDAKLQTQVFAPIDKWISEVDLFKGKMKILENLRLELDGSRRDHITIENKIAKQEAKKSEVDPKHAAHIQSKDASVAGKRTAFEHYEAQVYEELVTLIGETGVLHTALDRTLRLEIDTYQRALEPISSTTARLEGLSTTSPTGASATPTGAATGPATGYGAQTAGATRAPTGHGAQNAGATGAPTGAPTGHGARTAGAGHSAYPEAPTHPVGPPPAAATAVPTGPAPTAPAYEKPYAS